MLQSQLPSLGKLGKGVPRSFLGLPPLCSSALSPHKGLSSPLTPTTALSPAHRTPGAAPPGPTREHGALRQSQAQLGRADGVGCHSASALAALFRKLDSRVGGARLLGPASSLWSLSHRGGPYLKVNECFAAKPEV